MLPCSGAFSIISCYISMKTPDGAGVLRMTYDRGTPRMFFISVK